MGVSPHCLIGCFTAAFICAKSNSISSIRDPKDEPQLNLAIEVQADYLISRDNDLLDLMNWYQEAGREFQRRFRFLKIVKPEEFLQVMAQSSTH